MTVFIAEKNIYGLCSALFYAYTRKLFPDRIKEGCSAPNFADNYVNISTDRPAAERVLKALFKYGGKRTVEFIKICLLSCEESAALNAFNFARLTLDLKKDVSEMIAEKPVCEFFYTVRKVLNERHKSEGFLRFKETNGGVLYAPYSPDNDITALLCPHFLKRLSLPFVIHDVKRNIVGLCDGKTFKVLKTDRAAKITLSADESEWESLFKAYYNAVNIKERKNLKQQNGYMPKKYRKFMTETYETF